MTYDRGGSAGYRSFVDLGEAAEKRLTARPWIAQRPALCACHTASEAPHFRHWTEINKGPLAHADPGLLAVRRHLRGTFAVPSPVPTAPPLGARSTGTG